MHATIPIKLETKIAIVVRFPTSNESINQTNIVSNMITKMKKSPNNLTTNRPVSSVAGPSTFHPYGKRYMHIF